MKLIKQSLLIILSCVTLCTQAEEKIVVAVSEISNLLTKPPTTPGRYNRFLNNFDNVELLFMPPVRVDLEFQKVNVNCMFPSNTANMDDAHLYLESQPLDVIYGYVFARDESFIHNLQPNSTIAIRRGFTYGGIRETLAAKFVELDDDVAVLNFLRMGRVDAVIAYLVDLRGVADSLNVPLPTYIESAPIFSSREAFVCHDTPINHQFIQQANVEIREWLAANK